MLAQDAAAKYFSTGSARWWDRWLRAVESTSKFLGLDAPTKIDANNDPEDVNFTIIFDTPDAFYEDEPQLASNGSQTGDR